MGSLTNQNYIASAQKDGRYRSGLRTELFDLDSFDFELEDCKRAGAIHDDPASKCDLQSNHILKTTEVRVEPGPERISMDQYMLFPKLV